jgi:hypothetical protein
MEKETNSEDAWKIPPKMLHNSYFSPQNPRNYFGVLGGVDFGVLGGPTIFHIFYAFWGEMRTWDS